MIKLLSDPCRMRERVLHGVAGELRAVPVSDVAGTEFEVEMRVKRCGIDADAWLEPAHFFVESEVVLVEALADFASDGLLERFRKGLEKSRG